MSGLVGIWYLDGRPLDPMVLARMSATLRHRGPDGEGYRVTGPVGLACQHRWITPEEIGEVQPLVGPRGTLLVLDGRLDNRDLLLPALGLSPPASDAACVLAAYEAWGARFVERLVGDFALALFDPAWPRLLLARDAIGVRPLYYHRGAGFLAFASEIKALLAHPDIPARPDEEGIADYLLVSSRPIDRQEITCFAGIRALVPAHLLVATPDRVDIRRYWDFDPMRRVRHRRVEEYVEAFRERFTAAVERRLRSAWPVAVSVSGGLDSSSILCEALALKRGGRARCPAVVGLSYVGAPGSAADEDRYLAEIERAWGVSITRFAADPLIGVADGIDEQVRATEAPFVDYLDGLTRELTRQATARGARVVLSGAWGDQVLFSSAYLVDLFRRGQWLTIWRHGRQYVRWLGRQGAQDLARQFLLDLGRAHLPRPLVPPVKWIRRRLLGVERPRPWFAAPFRRRALRFANRPATLGGRFASAHARAIYFEARSKYHVHCLEGQNKIETAHGVEPAFPMMDRDLVAFLMAIPGEVHAWQGVPRALLRAAMAGVLPDAIRHRPSKGDFTDLVNRGVAQDAAAIRAALGPGALAVQFGYLDSTVLGPAIDRLAGGAKSDCVDSWDLADLVGLEAWLRVFFRPPPVGAARQGDAA